MSRSTAVASALMLMALPAAQDGDLTTASSKLTRTMVASDQQSVRGSSWSDNVAAWDVAIWDVAIWDVAGRSFTADDFANKVVLLDFWATWCAPCLAELPHLRQLDERFADDDFVILSVALDAIDRRTLRSFLLRHDMSWPQVHEPTGVDSGLAKRFAVEAVPVTVLVDRQGRLIARDLRGQALQAVVETLLE